MINKIKKLRSSELSLTVNQRLAEFQAFKDHPNSKWFSELCFCILTANSKAETALSIQKKLGYNGFISLSEQQLAVTIRNSKHRFHNNKASYIVQARKHKNIKKIIQSIETPGQARQWLVKNIKGIGYKEASHFLRNVGYFNVAILDRHIMNLMHEQGYCKKISPASQNYLKIENKFLKLCKELKMNAAELDLYMWYIKTGNILK